MYFVTNFAQSSNASVSKCWNCNAAAVSKPFLACDSCKIVQPMDPLWIISRYMVSCNVDNSNWEKAYEIEDFNLKRKYKDLQKKLHPDLVHTNSEEEEEFVAEQFANVIEVFCTLRHLYCGNIPCIHVEEEQTLSDPELLAEIMEIREAIDEATNRRTLEQIQCQVISWWKAFGDAFRNRKFEEAINSIWRMTYFHRINEEIVKKI